MDAETFIAHAFADTWINFVNAVNVDRIRRGLKPWSEEDAKEMFATLMAAPKE